MALVDEVVQQEHEDERPYMNLLQVLSPVHATDLQGYAQQVFNAFLRSRDLRQVLVAAVPHQTFQDVLPRHVETATSPFHDSAVLLPTGMLGQKMTIIALDVVHHHVRPAWTDNRHLYPSDFVSRDEVGSVAPEIIIGQGHRDTAVAAALLPTRLRSTAVTERDFTSPA